MSTLGPGTPVSPTTTSGAVGLGYGIAIAISTLVLISTIMLASYACIRIKTRGSGGAPRIRGALRHRSDVDVDDSGGGEDRGPDTDTRPAVIGLPGPMVLKVCLDMQPIKGPTYPELVLGESKRLPKPNSGPCSICLSEYKSKDTIRCMPDCNHCFHVSCIHQWLRMSPTCPICRSSPSAGPTPVATPLSELVPLAFHSR